MTEQLVMKWWHCHWPVNRRVDVSSEGKNAGNEHSAKEKDPSLNSTLIAMCFHGYILFLGTTEHQAWVSWPPEPHLPQPISLTKVVHVLGLRRQHLMPSPKPIDLSGLLLVLHVRWLWMSRWHLSIMNVSCVIISSS